MNVRHSQLFVSITLLGLALLPLASGAQGVYTPGERTFHGAQGGRFQDRNQGRDRDLARWSGDVDDTTIVTIHGDTIDTRTVRGKETRDIRTDTRGRLPNFPARVVLQRVEGRGEVRIVEQPRPENDFTIRVRIHDPRPGAARYRFTLAWEPLRRPADPY